MFWRHLQLHFFEGIFEVGDVSPAGKHSVTDMENTTRSSGGLVEQMIV